MQLTENRELTLRCNVRYAEYGMEGVNRIEVLDGETHIQTLVINDAIDHVYGVEHVEHREDGYYGLPDFEIMDINFDGFNDIGMFLNAGNVNENYLYYVWDEEDGGFCFACQLHGYDIQTDEARKRIVCYSRDGQGVYDTHEYAWLDDDQPTLVYWLRSKTEHPLHFIQVYLTHHELIDGEMKVTKRVVGEERIDENDDHGSYVLEKDIKIDDHNALVLRFYGQHSAQLEWIDVMDRDRVLYQTITFSGVGRSSIADVPSKDGNIQIADHNNDGCNDFSIEIEKDYPETGFQRHWWLWNSKTNQFDYAGTAE